MSLIQKKFMPLALLTVFAAAGTSVIACGDDDDTSTPTTDAGSDVTTTTDTGTADTGTTADTGPAATTWSKLGADDAARYAAVQGLVGKIVAAELADNTISPYFAAGRLKITGEQLSECLSQQVSVVLGAPATAATYPATVFPNDAAKKYTCRDMKTAHAGQGIADPIYSKFLSNAVTVVQANTGALASEITNALAPVLTNPTFTADIKDHKICATDADCVAPTHAGMKCAADTAPATTKSCQLAPATP